MEAGWLHKELGLAARMYPPVSDGSRTHAPWPVRVRLPDGTTFDVTDVRANPVEVILDVTPRRAP